MRNLLKRSGADISRPYERCLMFGASVLTDAELLAVIIRCGTKGMPAVELAHKILSLSPCGDGLQGLTRLTLGDLTRLPGIGEVKACELLCVAELSRRIAKGERRRRLVFTEPSSIADYYMEDLRHLEEEHILCVMLDTKARLIGEQEISCGTVNASLLSTRELFLAALKFRAVSIVLIHNHPSGDPSPSREDLMITEKVHMAGSLLDIRLLDHIIIGDRRYTSLRENGILDQIMSGMNYV